MNSASQSHIDSLCQTIHRALITNIFVSLFFIYKIARSDENLFGGGIVFSFTARNVDYSTFLLFAGIFEIGFYLWISMHLRIFERIEREVSQSNLLVSDYPIIVPKSFLFSTDIKFTRFVFTTVVEYLPPFFILFFCWKLSPVLSVYRKTLWVLSLLFALWVMVQALINYKVQSRKLFYLIPYVLFNLVLVVMFYKVSYQYSRPLDLANSDLSNKVFDGFNFSGASFFKANFEGWSFKSCSFVNADLRCAILKDAKFSPRTELGLAFHDFFENNFMLIPYYGKGADFTNAKLDQANVSGADFTEAIISNDQLSFTIGRDKIIKDSLVYTID